MYLMCIPICIHLPLNQWFGKISNKQDVVYIVSVRKDGSIERV